MRSSRYDFPFPLKAIKAFDWNQSHLRMGVMDAFFQPIEIGGRPRRGVKRNREADERKDKEEGLEGLEELEEEPKKKHQRKH